MREVIYSDGVIEKLVNLKKYLIDEYNNKIAEKVIKSITYKLDNLGVMDVGESLKDRFGIECDYRFLFTDHNYFIYISDDERIDILEMFNEKEDFIYVLFGIHMRSQESIDYWGE